MKLNLNRYVELDGDRYLMTFPFHKQMRQIEEYLETHRIKGVRKSILLDTCLANIITRQDGEKIYKPYIYSANESSRPVTMGACRWRPLLIPVKSKALDYDDWFKGIPNGTVRTGYSLRIGPNGGRPVTIPVNPVSKPTNKGDCYEYTYGMEIALGDTEEDLRYQLKWIVWEGTLVCTTTLIRDIPGDILEDQEYPTSKE